MSSRHASRCPAGPRAFAAVLFVLALTPSLRASAQPQKVPLKPPEMVVTRAPAPKPIDYDQLTQEAAALLAKYIQIDTTNPPGNELPAAKMLKDKLLGDGIPATTWEPAPGRGIVAARLHGIGKHRKAILLLCHMDVVPADPKEWEVPPFSGAIKDGVIWGRGAIDDKGPGVVEMMAMLAIKRAGILLDRDVILVATGDEEEGGKAGAGWFVDHQPSVYADAGYLLNEGGGIMDAPGGKKLYYVSVTEKTPLWLRLTATGPAGHAAAPPAETAVTRLVRALARLDEYHTPIRIIRPVENYYHTMAEVTHGPRQWLDLATALKEPAFVRQFVSVPRQNAAVRDTITPTVLSASSKTNVIAANAYCEIDCRLLPGTDPKRFLRGIEKVIDDKSIRTDVILNFPPVSSPQRSELMTAIEALARRDGKAQVVPTMISGFTDSHYFRQKDIVAYGFVPISVTSDEARGVHGINERISVKELGAGIKRMVELLELLGGR
ncbi:MAG TPA: M20/M25/M40 family metallo-hydrolase [Candidatus Binataceae bacterium]|nr:M20/M25/M40 family metallo-hydrolase [Candidatus Binataceae bacterium]